MTFEGVDWFILGKLEEYLKSKLTVDQEVEIYEGENSRSTDMWDHMEYWGEIKITITSKSTGQKLHRKTIRSTTSRSYSADRESQYYYKVDTSVFDKWFATPQQ